MRRGFTIIELLVVIAVIGVLAAVILPAVQQVRERARSTQCQNNLKQLGLALHNYSLSHGLLPPSFVRQEDGNPPPPAVPFAELRYRSHWTGFHMLLPFVDRNDLYEEYNFDHTWLSSLTDPTNLQSWPLNQTLIPTFVCPSASHREPSIGALTGGNPGFVITVQGTLTQVGPGGGGGHWMAGAPTDYSFSHGADVIRALPGPEELCPGGLRHYWSRWPRKTLGPFGYSSNCRLDDISDGLSQTFLMGEKAGSRLIYSGWNSSFPSLPVEYPWAMAAVAYFAPTIGPGAGGAFWVVGPFAATQDIRLPDCPEDFSAGQPFPMNPFPHQLPLTSDERPFYSFQSVHEGGTYFLFGDTTVRFLNESIDQNVYEALSTIANGEPISAGSF